MSERTPSAAIVVREHEGHAYFDAKFRFRARQVKRRIGPAWLEADGTGGWKARKGRVPEGSFDLRAAHVAAAQLVAAYVADEGSRESAARERRARGATFREVADGYMRWLADVKGAKPSTIADYRYLLVEPGLPHKRGTGVSAGHIMRALGDLPAARVTVKNVERMLATVSASGVSARSVNKHRALVAAIYNYGIKESAFGLPSNPATAADKRREPHRGALIYYTPEEVEALARAFEDGRHRSATTELTVDELEAEILRQEDRRDAEMVRVSAYAGLRQGELLALRWRDVDFQGHALTIGRAMSAGIESTTKSGRVRRVPLPDQAAAALDRVSRRDDFTGPNELVFCNRFGRPLNGSALRRRYRRAQAAAELEPLRWHDLRHTYGSLLAAAGVDLVTIQAVMGHSALATTGRYLHARPATDQAAVFTRAFESRTPVEALDG